MKLHLRELVAPLSAEEPALLMAEGAQPAEPSVWHDSSMELERGLDVVELSVDVDSSVCDALPANRPAALSTALEAPSALPQAPIGQ